MTRAPSSPICGMGCWNSSRCGKSAQDYNEGCTDVPFCARRLLCSRFAHCSADPMNSEEVVVEHVEVLGLSVVSFFLFRLGGGASGANSVVTSHALKKSETVKQQHTNPNPNPNPNQNKQNKQNKQTKQTKTNKHKHKPQTTNHKPQTTNHKPQTTNHKPQTTNHKPQTTNHKPQTTNHKPQTTNTNTKTQKHTHTHTKKQTNEHKRTQTHQTKPNQQKKTKQNKRNKLDDINGSNNNDSAPTSRRSGRNAAGADASTKISGHPNVDTDVADYNDHYLESLSVSRTKSGLIHLGPDELASQHKIRVNLKIGTKNTRIGVPRELEGWMNTTL